jgi:hypothetical protein
MSVRTYPSFPQRVYLPTDSTQGSFTITNGRKALTNTSGNIYLSGSTVHRLIPVAGARGIAIEFFGTDANNEALAAAKVWIATLAYSSGQTDPISGPENASYADLRLYGTTGAVTYSTATGAGTGDLVPSTSFIADTIASWTLNAYATATESAYGLGASAIVSPADNTPATLIIPNLGAEAHAVIIEFDLNTAASANALYTLTA